MFLPFSLCTAIHGSTEILRTCVVCPKYQIQASNLGTGEKYDSESGENDNKWPLMIIFAKSGKGEN